MEFDPTEEEAEGLVRASPAAESVLMFVLVLDPVLRVTSSAWAE